MFQLVFVFPRTSRPRRPRSEPSVWKIARQESYWTRAKSASDLHLGVAINLGDVGWSKCQIYKSRNLPIGSCTYPRDREHVGNNPTRCRTRKQA